MVSNTAETEMFGDGGVLLDPGLEASSELGALSAQRTASIDDGLTLTPATQYTRGGASKLDPTQIETPSGTVEISVGDGKTLQILTLLDRNSVAWNGDIFMRSTWLEGPDARGMTLESLVEKVKKLLRELN